jgi:hypothetical protein
VVTNVTCVDGTLVVTRERISITGCGLSISGSDVPSGAPGGPVDEGFCFPSGTVLCLTVPDGPGAGVYTATVDSGGSAVFPAVNGSVPVVNAGVTPPELSGSPAVTSTCTADPEPGIYYATFTWTDQSFGATSDYLLSVGC